MIRRSLAESTQCAELAILLADDRFLEYLYAVLPSWGCTAWAAAPRRSPSSASSRRHTTYDAISPLGILVLGNRRAVLDFAEYAPKSA
jgi:hypothetical protein